MESLHDLRPMVQVLKDQVVLHLQALDLCVVACRLLQRRTTSRPVPIILRRLSLLPRYRKHSRHPRCINNSSRHRPIASRILIMVPIPVVFPLHHLLHPPTSVAQLAKVRVQAQCRRMVVPAVRLQRSDLLSRTEQDLRAMHIKDHITILMLLLAAALRAALLPQLLLWLQLKLQLEIGMIGPQLRHQSDTVSGRILII